MNLVETYSKRLAISEAVYKKSHETEMTPYHKSVVARVLANTSAVMNESFSNSVGTQRADIGTN